MKKIGIVLILLLPIGFFSFQSITSSKTTSVNPVKIIQKIPAPESGKGSDKQIAEERLETIQPKGYKKSAILAKSVQNNTGKSIYSIQIGAYNNFDSAVDRMLNLVSLGYNLFYSCEMIKDKGQLYKVYTEQFPSKDEAMLKALELLDALPEN